ncbi:MAG: entericidin A/B family lipoprotein [Rhodobacteraceae bacterium]|nr:MAG: entericidin A/B family lipoprotein [Paracoccaceae bacterium]
MTRLTVALTALFIALGVGACNTVRGAGEDIESGGRAISDTATEVQRDLD